MTEYTQTFGGDAVPVSPTSYRSISLTVDSVLEWADHAQPGALTMAEIIDVDASVASKSLTLPAANEGSKGLSAIIRNTGSETFTLKNAAGGTVTTLTAGEIKFIYLTATTTVGGIWAVVIFGAGTSVADASVLAGAGLKAISSTLNQDMPIVEANTNYTVTEADRGRLIVFTSGSATLNLPLVADAGNGSFVGVRNSGTGTVTIDPASAETVDGQATLALSPDDALLLVCSGGAWFTVGLGRSVTFLFSKLTKSVAGGADVTLTAAEATNPMMEFTGLLTANINVIVPAVAAIYYVQNATTGAFTLTVKTPSGTGVGVQQGRRQILSCDGVNVYLAQDTSTGTVGSLADGTEGAPSLNFTSDPDTGMFLQGPNSMGFSVGGVEKLRVTSSGIIAVVAAGSTVAYAAISPVTTDRLLGRDTAGSGAAEQLTVGGGVEFTGAGGIQTSAFTGNVTKTAGGTTLTIPNDTVTYAMMQNVSATDRVLGRSGAGAGDVQEITCTSFARSILDDTDGGTVRATIGAAESGANTSIDSVDLDNTGLKLRDTNASHTLTIAPGSNLTANRTFTLTTGDGARTLDISAGSVTISAFGASLTDDADSAAARATLAVHPLTGSLNLRGTNTPSTVDSMDFTADAAVFRDSSGTLFYDTALSLTIDLSVSGSNGLNTGTVANDTWYHYYAIRKPDGTKAGLASTTFSHTAGPGSLPSGYTHWCYLAAVRYGTGELDDVFVRGNFVCREGNYTAVSLILEGGTATNYTAVSAATRCPPNTQLMYLCIILGMSGIATEPCVGLFRPTGSGTSEDQIGGYVQVTGVHNQLRSWHWMRPGTSQQIDYRIANTPSSTHGLNLYVLGYTVPNGAS